LAINTIRGKINILAVSAIRRKKCLIAAGQHKPVIT